AVLESKAKFHRAGHLATLAPGHRGRAAGERRAIEFVIKGDAPTPKSVTPSSPQTQRASPHRHPLGGLATCTKGGWGDDGDALHPLPLCWRERKGGWGAHSRRRERGGGERASPSSPSSPSSPQTTPATPPRNGPAGKGGRSRRLGVERRFC